MAQITLRVTVIINTDDDVNDLKKSKKDWNVELLNDSTGIYFQNEYVNGGEPPTISSAEFDKVIIE